LVKARYREGLAIHSVPVPYACFREEMGGAPAVKVMHIAPSGISPASLIHDKESNG